MKQNRDEIADLVRQVVKRTLGEGRRRSVLGEEEVRRMPAGGSHVVGPDELVTPLARQVARERNIELIEGEPTGGHVAPYPSGTAGEWTSGQKTVALGADHGGFALKEELKNVVAGAGYRVVDCGTHSPESVDYPDFAFAVARLVSQGQAWRGIIVDGAGIGSCMVANKLPGVRAAMCYDQATAVNSREHNDANVLTLGAGLIGPNLAGQIVSTWLATDFGGGRHGRRVDKIEAIGQRYMKR